MIRTFTISILALCLSSAAAFSQVGTSAQKSLGIGLRLGDPTGFTLKKYFGNDALEFNIGIPLNHGYDYGTYYYDKHYNGKPFYNGYYYDNYHYNGGIAIQLHYLKHFDIKPVEGLQWYVGGGGQFRDHFYEVRYHDNYGYYHAEKQSYMLVGLDVLGGAEYTFRNFPASVFADLNFFLSFAQQVAFYPQFGLGGRFNIK